MVSSLKITKRKVNVFYDENSYFSLKFFCYFHIQEFYHIQVFLIALIPQKSPFVNKRCFFRIFMKWKKIFTAKLLHYIHI